MPHWIQYKVLLYVYTDPAYICDLTDMLQPKRLLRSGSSSLLPVPRSRTTKYGDKTFQMATASLWNRLPEHVKQTLRVAKTLRVSVHLESPSGPLNLLALSHFCQNLSILDQIHRCLRNIPSKFTVEVRKTRCGSTAGASFKCLRGLWEPPDLSGPFVPLNLAKGEKLLTKGGKGHKGVQDQWMSGAYFYDLQGLWVGLLQNLQSLVLPRSDKKWQSPIQGQSFHLTLILKSDKQDLRGPWKSN